MGLYKISIKAIFSFFSFSKFTVIKLQFRLDTNIQIPVGVLEDKRVGVAILPKFVFILQL